MEYETNRISPEILPRQDADRGSAHPAPVDQPLPRAQGGTEQVQPQVRPHARPHHRPGEAHREIPLRAIGRKAARGDMTTAVVMVLRLRL